MTVSTRIVDCKKWRLCEWIIAQKIAREYRRTDRALFHARGAEAERLSQKLDSLEFMLPRMKAESLEGAEQQIQVAARWLTGAVPDEATKRLHRIGANLRRRRLSFADIRTLRDMVALVEQLSVTAPPVEFDRLEPWGKQSILVGLRNALATITRPRAV